MKKLKLLSTMIIIALLTSSIAGCTNGNESNVSSEPQVSFESSVDESKDVSEEYFEEEESEDTTGFEEYTNVNAYVDEWGATKNGTEFDGKGVNYFVDFTKEECLSQFYWPNAIEYTFNQEGYVSFKALSHDPYVRIQTPTCTSYKMKYLYILYKSSESTPAQLFVDRSDGMFMGQTGSYFEYNLEKTDEFKTLILDIGSLCVKDVYITSLRIDPSTIEGVTVDIKYIAGFETLENAEKFNAYDYNESRINEAGQVEWDDPEYVEQVVSDLDNYEGTLDIKDNGDGTVTIFYVKEGENVSYTVPNDKKYLFGGYAATDDLKRTLPNSDKVGIYGENGEYYVGIFYFMWLEDYWGGKVYDINKIIAEYGTAAQSLACGAWGGEYGWHFWGEPFYGYYFSRDEWVIRKHMELLSNANIDFLYFDVTNGWTYTHVAKTVMKVCHELNEQGFDAPQVVFYTNSDSASVVSQLYNDIYMPNYYPDTWFMIDGKPVIVAQESDNIDDFFTIRLPQWPTENNKRNAWPWIDFKWPQYVYKNKEGVGEAISVSVAQHSGNTVFSSSGLYGDKSNRGRSTVGKSEAVSEKEVTEDSYKYGYNFQAQWDRVFECIKNSANNPSQSIKYVLITGWNEWIAQRQVPGEGDEQEIVFIDTFSSEYSRDIEMTRGFYFDNYYLQLMENVSKLKGSAPVIIQDSRKPINVTGEFSQWDSVKVTYTDPQNDCNDRCESGWDEKKYVNQTGRNDIVSAKVTSDTKNLYFYVETAEDISMYDTDSAWMQLFINTDGKNLDGWYGYDYVINHEAKNQFTTTVAKVAKGENSTSYIFKTVGEVSYRVKDNKMMIAVPLEMLEISDYSKINVSFKWVDSVVKISNMEAFYELGDAAPLGRLNYVYRNY
ncbi:MAG: hypothetical protein E7614_04560 [Ruminococcaceae bacterium]|nr:hypothetical protein [Oscillospiraceae bacterium]